VSTEHDAPAAHETHAVARPAAPAHDALLENGRPAPAPPTLLAHPALPQRGNGPVRQDALIRMQRRQGNRAVQRLVHAQRAAAPAAGEAAPRAGEAGLPDDLRAGIEQLSGLAMDDVQVHYNSARPAEAQALAYAQGAEIHLGPGQERHLPHEAWHVAQQRQGRVAPTRQMQDGPVNDSPELEREADAMGARALGTPPGPPAQRRAAPPAGGAVVQRVVNPAYAQGLELAQRVIAMYALGTPALQQAELTRLQALAEPLKASPATDLGKLATVIAGGNPSLLQGARVDTVKGQATTVLAMAYEARDAGHSLDRHGPRVSDSQLQERLRTGVAPDGALSPTTGLSTRFNGHGDYVRTRLAAVQGMTAAITATRDHLKAELKTLATARKTFQDAPPGPAKAAGGPLRLAIDNAVAAVQAKVAAIGNPDATRMPIKFVPNAATPAGYITMYKSYSIIVDHGADIGIGFRGRAATQNTIPRPTADDPLATAPAWPDSDKEEHLTRTRTGMDTGANNQQLFGTAYDPAAWEAFQHFPVDEPVGIQN
jgi:hypothetical protein